MKRLRLLIAEDMEIVRKGLKALIHSKTDFDVCGEASDGQTAVELARTLSPDVVVMDLIMNSLEGPQAVMDGAQAIAEIKRHNPRMPVVALTGHGKESLLTAAMQAGANGYLLKNSPSEELFTAIASVAAGQDYFSKEATALLAQACRSGNRGDSSLELLSKRERQVLRLAAKGLTNREIAEKIFVSVKTVEKHKTNLKKKLGLRSSLELAAFCLEHGLLEDG